MSYSTLSNQFIFLRLELFRRESSRSSRWKRILRLRHSITIKHRSFISSLLFRWIFHWVFCLVLFGTKWSSLEWWSKCFSIDHPSRSNTIDIESAVYVWFVQYRKWTKKFNTDSTDGQYRSSKESFVFSSLEFPRGFFSWFKLIWRQFQKKLKRQLNRFNDGFEVSQSDPLTSACRFFLDINTNRDPYSFIGVIELLRGEKFLSEFSKENKISFE